MGSSLSNLLSLGNVLYVLIGTVLIYYAIVFLSLSYENKKEKQQNDPNKKEKAKILSAKFNGKTAVVSFLIATILNPFFLGIGGKTSTPGPGGPATTESPSLSPESTTSIRLHVGDIVSFGSYSVDENTPKEDWPAIQWIVIDIDGDEARLLSKNGLRYMPYEDESNQATIWLDSSIRRWLNEDFYEMALDKAPFILSETLYTISPSFSKNKYKSIDKVYLLSAYEVAELLSPEDRICEPTVDSITSFNGQEMHMDGDAWYLREEGKAYNYIASVDRDGTFTSGGSTNNGGGILVRPCITISISDGLNYIVIEKPKATTS